MPRALATASAAVILAAGGSGLAGCGSGGTKTASSNEPPAPSRGGAAAAPDAGIESSSSTSAASSSGAVAAESGGTEVQTTTRTAVAPAYVHEESPSAELVNAVAEVKAHGYLPEVTSDYHPTQTLRVLIGSSSAGGEGAKQQAFFFVGNRYLGTDSSQPSASLRVVSQGDTEITLAYGLYRPGDPPCCAGSGLAQVTFQLNDGALAPLQAVPPLSERR